MSTWIRAFLLLVSLSLIGPAYIPAGSVFANGMLEVAELLSHAEHYDRQMVSVVGRVTGFQAGSNQQGQAGYGFLLEDTGGTVKVVGLGKVDLHNGGQIMDEGSFSRIRQTGRGMGLKEIKASMTRPLDRLHPDLVG